MFSKPTSLVMPKMHMNSEHSIHIFFTQTDSTFSLSNNPIGVIQEIRVPKNVASILVQK